ncbi:MAG: YcbK family protein, partial [Stellaceae bacterium]
MNRRLLLAMIAGTVAVSRLARAAPAPMLNRLHLFNPHTGETFDGVYRNKSGPIVSAVEDLSYFLRDFHSGKVMEMDVGVIDFLAAVMDAANQQSAVVLSGYRTPETNAMLARTTFGVAEHSQHMYGRAIDVHFGANLIEAMEAARKMQRGGVGWYPHSGFMHIDSGPVRNWDLDASGLGRLLFGGRSIHFDRHGNLVISEGGRRVPLMVRGGRMPTVRQRMARLHRL